MKIKKLSCLGLACSATMSMMAVTAQAGNGAVDRTSLPIADPKPKTYTQHDVRELKEKPEMYKGVPAPKGAPNVLIILIDDFGYGSSNVFGGPINMPNMAALAKEGLTYNQFHTVGVSAATRTALLTGRNHHVNNMAAVAESATSVPGNTSVRPNTIAALPQVLKYNGYATAMFGKCHEVPTWQSGPAGPQDLWPARIGFDKFYGFIGAESDQYQPSLFDGVTRIETPRTEGYTLNEDLSNKTVQWIKMQKTMLPEKPLFIYYAPGAVHTPHHVPKEWSDKYKGKFDQGWDKLREEIFARQKQMGIIPQDTILPPMPDYIKRWDSLTADQKKIMSRQMEVFAGFAEQTDYYAGQVIQALKDMGEYENTIIIYMAGDNGASGEGLQYGQFNSYSFYNSVEEKAEDLVKELDKFGTKDSFEHYAAGWAVAGDTPFAWTKIVVSDFGGTTNGMVISWKKGITAHGEMRSQWTHVIDIAPTLLEAMGLPEPKTVNGLKQIPIQGKSFLHTFNDKSSPSRHTRQYFEVTGNRAIYDNGWFARVIHYPQWASAPVATIQNDKWELYNVTKDFALANDLSAKDPKKLEQMKKLFDKEAVANHVYPMDDRGIERINPAIAGRPDIMGGRTSLTLYEGMVGMYESTFINIKNRSYTITAEINVKDAPQKVNGVIVAQGGAFSGWSLFVKDGKPAHDYNWLGKEHYIITSKTALKKGVNTIKYVFEYDGNGLGKGGKGTMYLNGSEVGSVRLNNTIANMFSFDDVAAVGIDDGSAVSKLYEAPFKFTDKIIKITIDVEDFDSKETHKAHVDSQNDTERKKSMNE